MKLSICIPTHHGRMTQLNELLDGLVDDIISHQLEDTVQICISDNASLDGTEMLVERFRATHPGLIKYQRQEVNIGIRNFLAVIEMADAEYCWLMGSDDAVVPSCTLRIVKFLSTSPGIPGVTVNKLNFNGSLGKLIGGDHDQAMPADANQSRNIQGKREIIENLFIAFSFISSHIFRKKCWDDVITTQGTEFVLGFKYFPHTFLYCAIAIQHENWYWMSNYGVIQRLENFSFTSTTSNHQLDYAEKITADLEHVAGTIFPERDLSYRRILRRLFIIYWNPWFALKYFGNPASRREDLVRTRGKCIGWFGHTPLFWITTFPILCLPVWASRLLLSMLTKAHAKTSATPMLDSIRTTGQRAFHWLLRIAGIENGNSALADNPEVAADIFLDKRSSFLSKQDVAEFRQSRQSDSTT